MTTNAAGEVTRQRRRPPLDTLARVRQEMAYVYRQSINSDIPLGDATRLVFMLQALGRLLATETLEARILALESEQQPPLLTGDTYHGN